MSRGLRVFMALGSFILLGAISAHAQGFGRLRASLPFTFTVGSTTLPPGEYDLSYDDAEDPGVLTVRSRDGRQGALVLTEAADSPGALHQGRLVFEREGDRYVLTEIFSPGETVGVEILGTHPARERAD
jgi:hypothetical protein